MKNVAYAVLILFTFSILSGCAPQHVRPDGTVEGSKIGYCALIGAGVGGAAGFLTRTKKPLANTLIGAAIGGIAGAIICDIIEKKAQEAALEAAEKNRRVEYRTDEGQRIIAQPSGRPANNGCREIENEAWDNGVYLGKITRQVCPGSDGKLEIRS